MISAKDLTEEQRSAIEEWAREGSQLADIQKRLTGEFGLNVTYMDTRFLVLDLGIELESAAPEADSESSAEEEGSSLLDPAPQPPAGGVKLTLDEVVQPGAMVSGKVRFSDGETGKWLIDQMGRPGLDMKSPDYQPSEADMIAMEKELRKLLEG